MSDLSRLVTGFPEMADFVWDDLRQVLHLTAPGGVYSFHPYNDQLDSIPLSGRLSGLDISSDRQVLLVGQADTVGGAMNSSGSAGPGTATVHRVWLTSRAVETHPFSLSIDPELGVRDIAALTDARALFSNDISGSAFSSLRITDIDGPGLPLQALDLSDARERTWLFPSESDRFVLITDVVSSGMPIRLYDSQAGVVLSTNLPTLTGAQDFHMGKAAISEAAGLVAVVGRDHAMVIVDFSLRLVKDLGPLNAVSGGVAGVEFAHLGRQLIVWDAVQDHLAVYDTLSWQRVATVPVQSAVDPDVWSPDGHLELSSDGRLLFLDTPQGFEVVDLGHRLMIELQGGGGDDLLRGAVGADTLSGHGGADTLLGGAGADSLDGGEGQSVLRGEAGDDYLLGGASFDNMHGNIGSDTLYGGFGNDWVVGGQDNDWLFGEDGDDYIVANLAADTCLGGDGRDTLLGGQADDRLSGEAGDDRISGDRGSDTLSGGPGADSFDFFLAAGHDRITDFSYAEGDRVHILGGWSYTVQQVGADMVLTLGGSDQLILVGVNAASLGAGWVVAG